MSNKESSAHMASVASRIMQMAKHGGVIEANRPALRHALLNMGREDSATDDKTTEANNATADLLIDAMKGVIQPFIEDAESLAASVLGQREAP